MSGSEESGHIPTASGVMMIAIAVVIDAVQFVLTLLFIGFLINPIISFLATMLFGIWMSHHGVSMMSPKYALRFLGTIVGEVVLGMLPIWTFSITFVVAETKIKRVISPPTPRGRGGIGL